MVYGIPSTITMENTVKKKLKLSSISIKKVSETPNGYGDIYVNYSSSSDSPFGQDSGYFVLASTPNNCGLIWMGGVSAILKKGKCLKFEVLEALCPFFGHSGILLSQVDSSGYRTKCFDIYKKYGFFPILQDRGVIHGNNNDLRIYYKPLNESKKVAKGGKGWKVPTGYIKEEDLKTHNAKE